MSGATSREASSDAESTTVTLHQPTPRTSSETTPPRGPSGPEANRMPFKTTLGGRMVFDSRPMVESAGGGRPGDKSLVHFHSAPVLAPAPLPPGISSSAHQEPQQMLDGFPEECSPGSGHCTPPGKHKVEEKAAPEAESDTVTFGSANDDSDDGTNSLGDFFCKTAGSIERSWDAVKRAKPQRPTWMRWWSF